MLDHIVVQKYGGSSVADVDKIKRVAARIVATKERGYRVVAVVSAMGSSTDHLIAQAKEVARAPKKRELDMLVTAGERISMSLLTMAIQELGHSAISLTGSQCGIITSDSHSNARIIEVRPVRIEDELERDSIVIVAGFQGMSYKREVTTLGRGGSDTTAVALAAALGASWCEICSDVDGVYSADPRVVPDTQKIAALDYEEMEELGAAGAEVLNPDAIEFARHSGVKVLLTSTFKDGAGTLLIKREAQSGPLLVKSIAMQKSLIELRLLLSDDAPTRLTAFIGALGRHGLPVEMLHVSGLMAELALNPDWVPDWEGVRDSLLREFSGALTLYSDRGGVSLIGNNLAREPRHLEKALEVLSREGLRPLAIHNTRDRLTLRLLAAAVPTAARALHRAFLSPTTVND